VDAGSVLSLRKHPDVATATLPSPPAATLIWSRSPGGLQSYQCSQINSMASITIRNLDESLKSRLRTQAAVHGRSMED
jgi:hypothetical protein